MNEGFLKQNIKLNTRYMVIYVFMALFFGILLVNLIDLQIVKGNENLYLSTTIKTSEEITIAPRGLIYDSNDELLVMNRPSFKLVLDLTELPPEKEKDVLEVIADILELDFDIIWKDYKKRVYKKEERIENVTQITLYSDIERDKAVSISARHEELPGLYVEIGTTREYKEGELLAHILGYVREVSAEELEQGHFVAGDLIGSVGIEKYYDSILRGENGRRVVETNADDTVRELMPVEAVAGKSVKLSIDIEMQNKMTEALSDGIKRNNADGGAAVIMDVTNGEILTLVSLPTYDPNKIIKGLSYQEYQNLSNDPKLPLYNRAVAVTQPPGSTFKALVGSAGLQEGVIDTNTIFVSEGCMEIVEGYEMCEVGKYPHGRLNIYQALERSSNIFFIKTMFEYGIDKFNTYAVEFGLGEKTGIDLDGEQPGILASKETKKKLQGEPWYLGDSGNVAIGQGLTRVTPIQMVSWVSAIANGGTIYRPHIVTEIIDPDTGDVEKIAPEVSHKVPISEENFQVIRDGMHLVVNGSWGSAWPLKGVKADPAAKTGSAEAPRKVGDRYELQGHSWISGFYPFNNPRYAYVVYMEYGGWGYKSAEVMKDFFDWYDKEYIEQ